VPNQLSKEDARALARQPHIRDMAEKLNDIMKEGLKTAAGLFADPKNAGEYNPDAEKPLNEASTKTRFAMELTKQGLADRREAHVTDRTLGVLVLRERMAADSWEKHAAEVDAAEKAKVAMDVEAVESK
jgi:hypothetical protein